MLYDDVDVSVVDRNDVFGVAKTADPFRNLTSSADDVEQSSASNRNSSRKSSAAKWELWTAADSKTPAKQSKRSKGGGGNGGGEYDLFAGSGHGHGNDGSSSADSKQPDKQHELSLDFREKVAVSFQEKLSVLEERDRYIRENTVKDNKNMDVIVAGTCPDMCPEKERLLREINCSFSSFEAQIVRNEMLVVPEWLVKEYARSSADQDEPLPHELRPEPVLVDTMSHILANVVPRIEDGGGPVDAGEWYHFCWDRLRSLRKDIVQQQLCSANIVTVLERSARFHVCCAERLCDAERRVFDDKINAENLVNCLQMLFNMYDDLAALGVRCPNESEFRVYMMLLLLNSGDVPDLMVRKEACAAEAARLYFAYKLNLYAQFFKLAKRTTYLNACILQRYFGRLRTHILNVFVSAYSSGSQMARFPLAFVRRALEFDDDDETMAFVEAHGLAVHYDNVGVASEVRCSKSSFHVPDVLPVCKSSYIVRRKRVPMLQAIIGRHTFTGASRLAKVHSSFNERDVLKVDALWAKDQRQRVINMYGNIYEQMESHVRGLSASCDESNEYGGRGGHEKDVRIDDEGTNDDGGGGGIEDEIDYAESTNDVAAKMPEYEMRPLFAIPKITEELPMSAPSTNFSFSNVKSSISSTFNCGKIPFQQIPSTAAVTAATSMTSTTTTTTTIITITTSTTTLTNTSISTTMSSHFRFDALPAAAIVATSSSTPSSSSPVKLEYDSSTVSLDRDTTSMVVVEDVSKKLYDPEDEYESSDLDEPLASKIILADAAVPEEQRRSEKGAVKTWQTPLPGVVKCVSSEEATSDTRPLSPPKKSPAPSPPASSSRVIRRSEEIFDRLEHALSTFQSLYYYNKPAAHLLSSCPVTNDDNGVGGGSSGSRQPGVYATATTRKLRKLVKRRLKLSRARKYARLWRKKTQSRKHKRDNFVGIVHLPPDEYFRLWGVVGSAKNWAARNLVAEVLDNEKALRWSAALLPKGDDDDGAFDKNAFAGHELANSITLVPGIQSRQVICWKLLVSLPPCANDHQNAFVVKIRKLIRQLYCNPDADTVVGGGDGDGGGGVSGDSLGSVWSTRVRGVRVCLAADVRSEAVVSSTATAGLTCAVLFVCEKWEKWDAFKERALSVFCGAAYPPFVGAVVIGVGAAGGSVDKGNVGVDATTPSSSFKTRVSNFLNELRKRNAVSGCATVAWRRWTTVAKLVADSCLRNPPSPPFRACSLLAFVERVGGALFACLHCTDARLASDAAHRSPVPFIRAYNECLRAATRIVCLRDAREFNLTTELAEAALGARVCSGGGAGASAVVAAPHPKTNFTHRQLIAAAVDQFALVSFTKWPPKSTRKMESLLTEYCRRLDASNALLANVLRLMEVRQADTVQEISGRAPWLQIVELWFRYRLQSVPPEKYDNLFVIYGHLEVDELVERLAVEIVC